MTPDVPRNLHTWTQTVTIEVLSSLTCLTAGIDPAAPNSQCLGVDQKTGVIGYVGQNGGAIGLVGNMIAVLYTPPASTSDFTRYLAQNFGIAKPAYAQGYGFESLSPLMKLWSGFRNIVYLFFVVIFVLIGLAIMLRIKIDPRTVMTIENQIPKLIIGIILVTFSFAIAGFLIDLMYLSIFVIFNVFRAIDPQLTGNLNTAQSSFQGDNPLGAMNTFLEFKKIVGDSATGIGRVIIDLFTGSINRPFEQQGDSIILVTGIWELLKSTWDGIRNTLGVVVGILVGTLAFLIISIAILWAMMRLWIQLLQAYVYILLDIVLAPFMIAFGLLPGGPVGFSGWLRDIGANLIAFPTTIVMFLLGRAFMTDFGSGGKIFAPPLIGNPNAGSAFGSLIGLGIILMTPQVVNMMKEFLKAPQLKYTAAIGQAVGLGGGFPASIFKTATGIAVGSKEYRVSGVEGNQTQWSKVGPWRAFFSRIVGR